MSISLRRCIALSSDVWGFVQHRTSFGLFPWADAAQFNGQAVTPDRRSKYMQGDF
nr:MAG TPA: hypothetical protein [Caudoviricetes sp.]